MNASPSALCLALLLAATHTSQSASTPASPDELWTRYFASETAKLEGGMFPEPASREEWERQLPEYRRELREMLGLDPWPARTPLNPVITGTVEREGFKVEKLHFQSSPGLYVTADLYLPKNQTGKLPAILYVCGHGAVKKDGVSYGNKVAYQHHGAWFARHGYVCMLIDTIQLGEIEGIHHGTYREGMWWWNSRGFTPAGVEAWNSVRAIDYLQSRSEVDPERIGMTGRSGGGAYSWWTAAIDERVKVAAPIAGITDLHNHVVDGVVEGHCDCMFMVNTRRWDCAQVAALVAPRPLLIGNTDRDTIFPLDGVVRVHKQVAGIYKALNAETNLSLLITEGPHKDTQNLRVPVFHWFDRFLKGEDMPITVAAEKFFEPEELKVFDHLPADQIVTRIHESFVPAATTPKVPTNQQEWEQIKTRLRTQLGSSTFAAWPEDEAVATAHELVDKRSNGTRLRVLEFETQPGLPLQMIVLEPRGGARREVELRVLNHADWQAAAASVEEQVGVSGLTSSVAKSGEPGAATAASMIPTDLDHTVVLFAPRAAGLTAPELSEKSFIQFRRRFLLLGQTLDGMRVWDIRQALRQVDQLSGSRKRRVVLHASGSMAVNSLFAGVFESGISGFALTNLPTTLAGGPDHLMAMKFVDLPTLIAAATVDCPESLAGNADAELTRFAAVVRSNIRR